ncbi:hypothetical protein ACIQNG_15515 [Streptomyces sp. NPDC091377]|uniref:hypothetical protein n=1 Tax=Streptomyces sp. NPDC091377 TaxID=3365995 RepID=UPI0038008E2D
MALSVPRAGRRGTPGAVRGSTRRRILVLCGTFLVAGSPWAQEAAWEFYGEYEDFGTLRWLLEAMGAVWWDVSAERYAGTETLVAIDVSVALLIAVFAALALRFTARGDSGLLRCLGVGLLASELAALSRWLMLDTYVSDFVPYDEALRDHLLGSALDFGLLAGVLLALVTAGAPRVPSGGPSWLPVRPPLRPQKGTVGMTTPQPHMPVGRVPGDVTRYLCTAAYVDEEFAGRVVDEVVADEAGAIAPSPDVDLVAVAHHCLAAQETRHARNLRLAAAVAAVAVVAPLWVWLPRLLLGVTAGAGRALPSRATRGSHDPAGRALTGTWIRAGSMVAAAFLLAVTLSTLPLPGVFSWLFGTYLGGIPAVLVTLGATGYAYVTVVRHDLETDRTLRATMTRERFYGIPLPPVPPSPWIAARLAALKEARDGNTTVYSGFVPFKGYASTDSTWSLAVPLLPADESGAGTGTGDAADRADPGEPRPFTVVDLVDHLRDHLRTVARRGGPDDEEPEAAETLRSLTVEDRVFASGTGIGDDSRFIAPTQLAPLARLTPESVEEIMLNPTGTVRHCLAVHVPLWGGDVVPSVFLHFSTAGRTLHVSCDNHVLGPVAAEYHVADRLRGSLSAAGRRGLTLAALSRTGRALYRAPADAWRHHHFEQRHRRRMLDELTALEEDPVYDFGARVSVRELALSPRYQNYFQVVDAARITAALGRHTLAAIREFLDARGYDTTDFRSQQQTILNQGLIQQGGMSIIGNQAIGSGASATQNLGRPPAQPGPGGAGTAAGPGGAAGAPDAAGAGARP